MGPLAGLAARGIAGIAARFGAKGAASAAARLALGRGAKGAKRAAAGMIDVLANSRLTNARQITAALRGSPPIAATTAASGNTAQQAAGATASGAAQAAAGGIQTMIGSSGGKGGGGGTTAAPAAPAPSGGGSNGAWGVAKGFASLKDGFRSFAQSQLANLQRLVSLGPKNAAALKQMMQSVSDRTAGMSEAERAARLNANGFMPSRESAGMRLGTPNPTQGQMNQLGEADEEEARQKNVAELERGAQANQEFMKGVLNLSAGLAGVPSALAAFVKGIEMSATLQFESARNLSKFNGQIAGAFRRLDYGDMVRAHGRANATGGTTAALGDALNKLRDDIEPFRQIMTTGVNSVITVGVKIASGLVTLAKSMPGYWLIERLAKAQEEANRKALQDGPQADFRKFARDVANGNYNRRP